MERVTHHPPVGVELRRTLAEFASGVTVVTASSPDGPVGFACQSFTSVSLDPPLVLFCVTSTSRSWPPIRDAGRFTVHVLAEDQDELCSRFGSRDGARFDGLDHSLSTWGTPALTGALARVHCDIEAIHGGGDHAIVVGRVLELERATDGGDPMIFFRGQFGVERPQPTPESYWADGWA